MAQRLLIARALMHDPEVLFLDEPTTGLDPQARLFVWDRVRDLRGRGVTTLLTTHDMDEAAELCDRVGIIDHGKLLALDTPVALARGLTGEAVLELSATPAAGDTPSDLVTALGDLDGVESVEQVAAPSPAPPAPRQRATAPGRPATARPACGCTCPGSRRPCSARPSRCSEAAAPC